MTLDHVVPVAHGGPFHIDNLRPAHELCNKWRGALPASELPTPEPGADKESTK